MSKPSHPCFKISTARRVTSLNHDTFSQSFLHFQVVSNLSDPHCFYTLEQNKPVFEQPYIRTEMSLGVFDSRLFKHEIESLRFEASEGVVLALQLDILNLSSILLASLVHLHKGITQFKINA